MNGLFTLALWLDGIIIGFVAGTGWFTGNWDWILIAILGVTALSLEQLRAE